jgi:hypothetical protein
MVLLEGASLERHQNIQSGELCVMDNAEDAWDPAEHDELFLLSQALWLLRDSEAGPGAVQDGELDAPEPVAPQVVYEPNSRAFLPDLSHARATGTFQGRLSPPGSVPATFVLTVLDGSPSPKMELLARLLGATRSVRGLYRMINAAPGAASLASVDTMLEWFHSRLSDIFQPYRLADTRLRRATVEAPLLNAAIAIYADEALQRGARQNTALVHIEEGTGQKRGGVRRAFFAPQVFPTNGDFVRMPGCEALLTKHVAVIGCGAVGSMIATALCRVGIGRFTLVDYDALQLDNLVRHECNMWGVGFGKAIALGQHLLTISPLIEFQAFTERFGGIGDPRYPSRFEEVLSRLRDADLVICATGGEATSAAASAALPGQLIVHAWAGGGAAGGRILKETSNGACFECFRFHVAALDRLPDNGEEPIYPTGCGFPTFTGRMYDIELIAQWAAKIATMSMLGEDGWPATDNAFVIDNRDSMVRHQLLAPHANCSRHGRLLCIA